MSSLLKIGVYEISITAEAVLGYKFAFDGQSVNFGSVNFGEIRQRLETEKKIFDFEEYKKIADENPRLSQEEIEQKAITTENHKYRRNVYLVRDITAVKTPGGIRVYLSEIRESKTRAMYNIANADDEKVQFLMYGRTPEL